MKVIVVTLFVLFLLVCNSSLYEFTEEDYQNAFPQHEDNGTLKLVIVLFRHGNRTPDLEELYPKDPYLNFTYFPYGPGQLTDTGKIKEYSLGVSLRNRYNKFLGRFYYPEIVEAISTDYNRTKMSLELVLAGMFPPPKELVASLGLLWQPIPYNYYPRREDRILLSDTCPKYTEIYNQHNRDQKTLEQLKQYQNITDYLEEHTGLNITRIYDIYNLYFALATEEEFGLALPDWTELVWPEPITSIAVEQYFLGMDHPIMRRILAGYLLDKFIQDAEAKITNPKKLSRKVHLYSAHENNLAQFLIAAGIFEKHIPTYGSHVVLELHVINNVYGFKIFYNACDEKGLRLMKMPHCEEFCSLDQFKDIVSNSLIIDHSLCGK